MHPSYHIFFTGFWVLDCTLIRQYHYVDLPLTWQDAKAHCQSKNSDLASARTNEDLKLLHQAAGSRIGWVGLQHVASNWSWTMEDNPLYEHVFPNAPAGILGQCVKFQSGILRNVKCLAQHNFVCQNSGK